MLEIDSQFKETVNRSRFILITFHPTTGGDGAFAALALAEALKKMGKQVEVASDNYQTPLSFNFLEEIKNIRPQLSPLQKFIIKIDISKNQLASLSYDVKDANLYVYITPKTGVISHEAVKTASSDLKFDLIITVDTPDLHSLGNIYLNNTELFSRVPVINIDHNPANEHYGKINLVDLASTACSEVIFEILQKWSPDLITPSIATLLLTGLILKTSSFRSPQINSRTLNNASKLVELGAEREKIVQNLYRRRTLPTLKLWGKALSSIKNDPSLGLVSLSLTKEDFLFSGAGSENLTDIIDELIANSPEAKIIVLLYQTNKDIEGIIHCAPNFDALMLGKPFNPEGTKQKVKIILKDGDLITAEKEVVEYIKKSKNS